MSPDDQRRNPEHASPQYSLIIAILHDKGDLLNCLNSLVDQQSAPAFETIIIDQNGDDRLVNVVAAFANRLRLVHKQVNFRGACRARNLGASMARGGWLGFPGDDCVLLSKTLFEVVCVAQDPQVLVITGCNVDPRGAPNVMRCQAKASQFDRWNMLGCLTEVALFFPRNLCVQAGGFDVRLGSGIRFPATEGIDLMNQLFKHIGHGIAISNPSVVMQHPTKIPPWNRWAVSRFHQ